MNDALLKYGEEWKSLPRNNSSEIHNADEFYDVHLFPLVADKFFMENANEAQQECDLMFVTIGTSWQPVALSIGSQKPKKTVFLYAEGVKSQADKVIQYLKLEPKQYDIFMVDKADSELLMRQVEKSYVEAGRPNSCCFDVTGGTKAMAAGAAMIAAKLNIDIFYVESNYLPVFRHPEPGSEKFIRLLRPQDL